MIKMAKIDTLFINSLPRVRFIAKFMRRILKKFKARLISRSYPEQMVKTTL